MINIGFKPHYRVLHFTSEIGKYIVGGIASFMDELYRNHSEDVGFVHFYESSIIKNLEIERYPGVKDILAVPYQEVGNLKDISFDIAVVHFYALNFMTNESILKGKPLVYVVHSVPTPEPYDPKNPFGIHLQIKRDFEAMCKRAKVIVCVSNAEKEKLQSLYPEFKNKLRVIHNGMNCSQKASDGSLINDERKVFGFIGRLDYRKGLFECIKEFREIDGKLLIACDNQDSHYLNLITSFIDGAGLKDKIKFLGWCQGER